MKSLTKSQCADRAKLSAAIREKAAALTDAVAELNQAIAAGRDKIEAALEAVNAAIQDANDYREGVHADMEMFADDKSEKWLESERGQQFTDWSSQWQEELPEVEIELPEEIEEPEVEAADLLDDLPEGS